jgi:hypothetical protein
MISIKMIVMAIAFSVDRLVLSSFMYYVLTFFYKVR